MGTRTTGTMLLLSLLLPVSANAQLLRPAQMLSGYMVASINLDMSPAQARAALERAGYEQISTSWETGSDASPQNPSTWTYRKGLSTVEFSRTGDEISSISEVYIRSDGTQFDVQTEYNRVKQHFAVGDDERACQPPTPSGAVCAVVDDKVPYEYLFGIQILPTIRTTQLERAFRE